MVVEGYILHHTVQGETQCVLKCFTKEQGLLSVIANPLKTRRLGWKNQLCPFVPLSLTIERRGHWYRLVGVEIIATLPKLVDQRLYAGLYLNEILLGFLAEHDPMPTLWDQYHHARTQLAVALMEPVLRVFELSVLSTLGYMPTLLWDQAHQPVLDECFYEVRPGQLPKLVSQLSDDSVWLYTGRVLRGIALAEWDEAVLKAAKRLMRQWIGYYRQGKTLKSRALFF